MKKYAVGLTLFALLGASSLANTAIAAEKDSAAAADKLIITDTKVGTGDIAEAGKKITVHYTGWLYSSKAAGNKGKKIDSSHDRGKPYSFLLGRAQVIDGWDQGLEGMKVGGQRNLIVPSKLGYGGHGAGEIVPPDSKLVFDVELLKVE